MSPLLCSPATRIPGPSTSVPVSSRTYRREVRLRFDYDVRLGTDAGSDDRWFGLTSGHPVPTRRRRRTTHDALTGGSAVRSRVVTTTVVLVTASALALAG